MTELNLSLSKYNNKAGYFCLANNGAFGWQQNFYKCSELEKANDFIMANSLLDSYNSVATFRTHNRSVNNVRLLTEHYIDIDNHLSPFTLEEAKEFIDKIKPLFDIAIPTPSQAVYSGRGVQLHFNLKDAKDLRKWQYTQEALINRLEAICYKENALLNVYGLELDKSCKDASRVLRTINTLNSKSNTYSTLIFSDEKAIYTQDEIIGNYNLEIKRKNGTYKLNELKGLTTKQVLKASKRELKTFKAFCSLYTRETLNQARKNDLYKLIELRNIKGISEGYRNNLLSIAVQLIRENSNDINSLINEMLDYNNLFNEPLTEQEVISWCNSAVRKQLYFSNKKIIEKLNISIEEQKQLSTIISVKVKNNRYYLKNSAYIKAKQLDKYKPIMLANKTNKNILKLEAIKLKEQGLKPKEIALKLNISLRTYFRYIKGYK